MLASFKMKNLLLVVRIFFWVVGRLHHDRIRRRRSKSCYGGSVASCADGSVIVEDLKLAHLLRSFEI